MVSETGCTSAVLATVRVRPPFGQHDLIPSELPGPRRTDSRYRKAVSTDPVRETAVSTIASGLSPVAAHKVARATALPSRWLAKPRSSDLEEADDREGRVV